jgi:hypothetical protein
MQPFLKYVCPNEKPAMRDLVALVLGMSQDPRSPQEDGEDLQSRLERFRRLDGEQVLKLLISAKAAGTIVFMGRD